MKRFLNICLVLSVSAALLAGCGSEMKSTKKENEWKTAEVVEEEKVPDFPARYKGYTLNVTHAKTDGEYITVHATYTNNNKESANAWSSYSFKAFQDGVELEDCSDSDGDQSSLLLEVKDGASCLISYKFRLNSESDIEIRACTPTEEEEILAEMTFSVADIVD